MKKFFCNHEYILQKTYNTQCLNYIPGISELYSVEEYNCKKCNKKKVKTTFIGDCSDFENGIELNKKDDKNERNYK
jgi:hypothetical protein